ncbi:MAG: histidine kinase N-terminal 7TM domain-containing protein [Bacillota bacterium]
MLMEFSPFLRTALLIFAVILSLILMIYTWLKGKRDTTLYTFISCQVLLFIWATFQILRIYAVNYNTEWLDVRFEYSSICFIALSWLVFCLYYTESKFLNKRNLLILSALPVLFYISVLTNEYHHLFFAAEDYHFTKKAVLFWLHTLESYGYCITGTYLLIKYSFRRFGYIRKQIILLVAAFLVPIAANLVMLTGLFDPGFDITPLSFTISLVFFAVAIFKYKLLNIIPIALRKIVDTMPEAILVIDNQNRVVDYNQAFRNFFPESDLKIGSGISGFAENLRNEAEKTPRAESVFAAIDDVKKNIDRGGLIILKKLQRSFTVNIQSIYSKKAVIGRVISFNEVTDYQNLWNELQRKNLELSTKNQQLEKYSATVEELAVARERNRFARDVHDTLGQTITLLITLLQIAKNNYREDPKKGEARIDESIKIANEGLKEVRLALIGLAPENFDCLKNTLTSLVEDFQTSGMKVQLSIDDLGNRLNLNFGDAIYRICQESLTNALRHGKASQVFIRIMNTKDFLKITIEDDGCGCKNLVKGLGLSGMEERISSLNGKIRYQSAGKGFGIEVEIPWSLTAPS